MISEIEQFMLKLAQLKSDLEASWEKIGLVSSMAFELDGEFRQEISTDLDGLQLVSGNWSITWTPLLMRRGH